MTRRVKRLSVGIGRRRQLVVSFRRFRTQKANRSRRFFQLVFSINVLSYREVAVAYKRRPKTGFSRRSGKPTARFRYKSIPAFLLIVAGLIGITFSGLNITKPVDLTILSTGHVSAATLAAVQAAAPMPRSLPVHITIPKINMDSNLLTTGLNADGTIHMPDRWDIPAWYTGSPTPGQLGPAIIVGHVDHVGTIGIFWRLRELVPGDAIQITRADGSIANFTVIEADQFPQNDFPTKAVYGNIGYAGLRLITCGGTFSDQTGRYNQNTVIFAALTAHN